MGKDKQALGEYADEGYRIQEYDDHVVTVCFKDKELAAFSQVGTTPEALQAVCKRHKDGINGNPAILYCRNCVEWRDTAAWRGNCNKHPWEHNRYSQDAVANGCEDYVDKYAKYKVASRQEI